jgi:phosphate transport system substrate-binding protein
VNRSSAVTCMLLLAWIAGGCSGSSTPPQARSNADSSAAVNTSGATLTGAGATFPYPLYSKWFDTYRQRTGIAINYQSIGSGAGIQQLRAGTVDFGASDAALSDAQLQEMPGPVLHLPTTGGAVVLAYNLPGVVNLRLTPDAVAAIFLGSVKRWNDPVIAKDNPGVSLPTVAILPVHRSDGSGTTNIFTTYLAAVHAPWKQRVGVGTAVEWSGGVGGKGNDGVAGVVRQTPGAIGYVELAYARQNGLTMAALRNQAGQFVAPSVTSAAAAVAASAAALQADARTPIVNAPGASSYPISALTFLLVYQDQKDAARARAFVGFVTWALHDGQSLCDALDYVPPPQALVAVDEATLRRITVNGKPLPPG